MTIGFSDLEPFLDRKRERLLTAISDLGPDGLQWTEYPGGWNAAQIVEHLCIFERMIVEEVRRLLAGSPPYPSEPLEAKEVDITELFRSHGLLGAKMKSSPEGEPTGTVALADGLDRLFGIRAHLKSMLPGLAARETNSLVSRHPLGVDLNVCQWVLFSAFHEWSHQHQVERIRKAHTA